MKRNIRGFTIVELLIVIVVVAILAGISIVAYNGVQQRARDSQRKSDISALTKALELYYTDKSEYPPTGSSCGVAGMNGWVTTADEDGCWTAFMNYLKPYMNQGTVTDPAPTPASQLSDSNDLFYSGKTNYIITTYYCSRQTYQLIYTTEQTDSNVAVDGSKGSCSTMPVQATNSKKHVIVRSKV